jgi:hypothetical protein
MILMSTDAIASSSRIWMNPPNVYEVVTPKSHITMRITKIVQSISILLAALNPTGESSKGVPRSSGRIPP